MSRSPDYRQVFRGDYDSRTRSSESELSHTELLESLESSIRKALHNMQYTKIRDSDGGGVRRLFSLLSEGPAPSSDVMAMKGLTNSIIENILIKEESNFKNRIGFQTDKNALQNDILRFLPHQIDTATRRQLRKSKYESVRIDLLHPSWYFGFVNDTTITIEIPELYMAQWARGRIRFSKDNEPLVAIDFHVASSGGLPLAGQKYFSVQTPSNGVVVLPIANLTELIPSKYPLGSLLHHLVDDPEQSSSMPVGFLNVWHVEQWKKMYQRGTLDDADGSYISTSILDNATIEITTADDTRAAMMVEKVEIELNGSGRRILDREYSVRQAVKYGKPLRLSSEIAEYRKHFLLGGTRRTMIQSGQYDVNKINNSIMLQNARSQLHKFWSRGYGLFWSQESTGWLSEPYGWCSALVSWCYRNTFPSSSYPYGGAAVEENWFWDRRENRKFYICAHPDHIDQETGRPFRYVDLGTKVQPGYLCWIRNNGHVNLFIYWLRPRKILGLFKSAFDVRSAVDEGPSDDRLPGDFVPASSINWFRAIGGNQGGGCVTVKNYAIVNIDSAHHNIIDALKTDGILSTSAVFWCANRDLVKYDGFGIPNFGEHVELD